LTLLFSNDAGSTLAGGINDTATSALLQSGTGDRFPNPSLGDYFKLTFISQSSSQDKEIVHVTSRTGDTITIVRGREGTPARSWIAGDFARHMVTADSMAAMTQNINLFNTAGGYAGDTGTANAVIATFSPVPPDITAYSGALLRIRRATQINTGAVTLQVNTQAGPETRSLVNAGGIPLIPGQLTGPTMFICVYDPIGDAFRLQSFSYPPVGMKVLLLADVTFYVNAGTGNDSNNGLVSAPWRSLQHAYDYVTNLYDFSAGFNAIVKVNGSYAAGLLMRTPIVGGDANNVIFEFQPGSQVNVTNNSCFIAFARNAGVKLTTAVGANPQLTATGSGFNQGCGIIVNTGEILLSGNLNFGSCDGNHMSTVYDGRIQINSSYSISGGAQNHLSAFNGKIIHLVGPGGPITATLVGTPAFSGQFASCLSGSFIYAPSGVIFYSGSATGKRYTVQDTSFLHTAGGGGNFFPGSIAGTAGNAFNYG
jgi:hypothetical protein